MLPSSNTLPVNVDASFYCSMVGSIANVHHDTLVCQKDEEFIDTPQVTVPLSSGGLVSGTLVHDDSPTPTPVAIGMTYNKSQTFLYSESVVFGYLKTLYHQMQIREEAAAYANNFASGPDTQFASGYNTERREDNITETFGYIFFSRYSESPTDISELLKMLDTMQAIFENQVHDIPGSPASTTTLALRDEGAVSIGPSHTFATLTSHIQCAVALQHFMQTTVMFPARYVKNACIQMVTTYVDSIIHCIFYTRLSDDYAAVLASQEYTPGGVSAYTIDLMSSSSTSIPGGTGGDTGGVEV